MKMTIRNGIFETNSSMTHSLIICTKEEMEEWRNGELFRRRWGEDRLVTKEEMEKIIANEKEYADRDDFETYDEFMSDHGYWELEHDGGEFTTPSGDEMCWVAAYGRDG